MIAKKETILFVAGILGWISVSSAYAETQTFNADIRFVDAATFTNATRPDFGNFEAGAPGRNFVLETDGSISGADAIAYEGGANAGSIEIHGSSSQKIDIVAQNFVGDGGVNVAKVICNYGDTGNVNCGTGISAAAAATDTGATLLLGLDVNTATLHANGASAAPMFDLIVSYN